MFKPKKAEKSFIYISIVLSILEKGTEVKKNNVIENKIVLWTVQGSFFHNRVWYSFCFLMWTVLEHCLSF